MQGHPTGTGLTLEQKKSRLWGSKAASEQPQVKALHSRTLHRAALKATPSETCWRIAVQHVSATSCLHSALHALLAYCSHCLSLLCVKMMSQTVSQSSNDIVLPEMAVQADAGYGVNRWDTAAFSSETDKDKFSRLMVGLCATWSAWES